MVYEVRHFASYVGLFNTIDSSFMYFKIFYYVLQIALICLTCTGAKSYAKAIVE